MPYRKLKKHQLQSLLISAQAEVHALRIKLENSQIMSAFILKDEENCNLPVPRVEINYSKNGEKLQSCLCLVYYGLLKGRIECAPILASTISGGNYDSYLNFELTSLRLGGELRNLMYELSLPGFLRHQGRFKEIDLNEKDDLPLGLVEKKFPRNIDDEASD